MSSLRAFLAAILAALVLAGPAVADPAHLLPDGVRIAPHESGVTVEMSLSQPVPWRVTALSDPPRIALEFKDLAPGAGSTGIGGADGVVTGLRTVPDGGGWTRLVLDLARPMRIETAGLATSGGTARLRLVLVPEAKGAVAQAPPVARPPDPAPRLHVMLDPGHGGADPGADAGGMTEAPTMLAFARDLRDVLLGSGFEVSMTRTGDAFVPLETRITLTRAAGADVLLSLHADALPDESGPASGVTVYTMSDAGGARAARKLAERYDRADLLSGVDLDGQGDAMALVLMDLARRDTAPRAAALADALAGALERGAGPLNSRPRREAAFSVLKSPDIPSVLLELGFLSSEADRARLADPAWRGATAAAIRDGLHDWVVADRFHAALLGR